MGHQSLRAVRHRRLRCKPADLAAFPLVLGLNPNLVFPHIARSASVTRRLAVSPSGPYGAVLPAVQLESVEMIISHVKAIWIAQCSASSSISFGTSSRRQIIGEIPRKLTLIW